MVSVRGGGDSRKEVREDGLGAAARCARAPRSLPKGAPAGGSPTKYSRRAPAACRGPRTELFIPGTGSAAWRSRLRARAQPPRGAQQTGPRATLGSRGRATRVRGREAARLAPRGPSMGAAAGEGLVCARGAPHAKARTPRPPPRRAQTQRAGGSEGPRTRPAEHPGRAYLSPLGRRAPLPASLPGAEPGATQCSGRWRGTSPVHVTAAWRRPGPPLRTPREGRPSAPRRRGPRHGLRLLSPPDPRPQASLASPWRWAGGPAMGPLLPLYLPLGPRSPPCART